MFTYVIGLLIAAFSNQIDLNNNKQLAFVFVASVFFFVLLLSLVIRFKIYLKNIVEEIKSLNL